MPQIMRYTSRAMKGLGFNPTTIFRGLNGGPTWAAEAARFVHKHRPEYVISWQRLYGEARPIWQAVKDIGARLIIMDFGMWPHYNTACYDSEGENRASSLVGNFDTLEADKAQREATDRMMPLVTRIAEAMKASDREAARVASKVMPDGLPKERDFIFLALQRCARGRPDKVLELDAVPTRRDPARVAKDMIAECERQNRFVVIKQHPQGFDISPMLPKNGPHHFLMPRFDDKSANQWIFGWCIWNMAHLVTVNSTTWSLALACGKPVATLGRGWYSSNNIVQECKLIRDAIPLPESSGERGKRFLALMLTRQLQHIDCRIPHRVRPILQLIHPGRF